MFGNAHLDRLRQTFADQFEAEGADYLYRRSLKDAPVRVTAAERNRFIDAYGRRLRYLTWAIVPATVLLIGLLVAFFPDRRDGESEVAIYVGLGFILVPFLVGHHRIWNAPARELDRRPVMGAARTRDEISRLTLMRLTYGQLGSAMAIAGWLVLKAFDDEGPLHGQGLFWLALAMIVALVAGWQAFRKWRSERS